MIMRVAKVVAKPVLHLHSSHIKAPLVMAHPQHTLRQYNLRLFTLIVVKWVHVPRSQLLFTRNQRLFSTKHHRLIRLQLTLRLHQQWLKRLQIAQQEPQLSQTVRVCSLVSARRQHIQRQQQAMVQVPPSHPQRCQCRRTAQLEQRLSLMVHVSKVGLAQAGTQHLATLRQRQAMTALAHQAIHRRHPHLQIAQRAQQPNQMVHVWKVVQSLLLPAVLLSFTLATQQRLQARHRLMATHLTVHMPRQIICLSANRAVFV
jgi:hypothetical protein